MNDIARKHTPRIMYACTVTRKDGSTFENPLKVSELHLISALCTENESVVIKRMEVTQQFYSMIFG